MKNIKNIAVHH